MAVWQGGLGVKLSKVQSITAHFKTEDLISHGTNFCSGCAAELAIRFTLKVLGEDIILVGCPGCASAVILAMESKNAVKSPTMVPTHMSLLTNVASTMTGIKRYYQKINRDIQVVSFVGDGATADIGFQVLSGAAERGENIIFICYDNEGYMNTGIQRSATTPFGAWTTTTEVGPHQQGKRRTAKNIPLLMALHEGVTYAATATVGFLKDYAQKLEKAIKVKDGLVYIHLFSPCPIGWRAAEDNTIELCQLAVETNYFPLWEAEKGVFRITNEVKNPKPVQEFIKLTNRYAHLTPQDLQVLQKSIDSRYALIQKLVKS
jgi:pyruvate/2-oxoacid:ferredoxin oxidoreductase beta subunit